MRDRIVPSIVGVLFVASALGCDGGSTQQDSSTRDREISSVDWPASLSNDASMLDAAPDHLGSMERLEMANNEAYNDPGFELYKLRYSGGGEDVTLRMTNLRKPGMAPKDSLLLFFGQISESDGKPGCDADTYRGSLSASIGERGVRPDTRKEQLPQSGLPWFSCQVSLTADGTGPIRYVVGWFTGELVWVIDGSSAAAVQELVDELANYWDG